MLFGWNWVEIANSEDALNPFRRAWHAGHRCGFKSKNGKTTTIEDKFMFVLTDDLLTPESALLYFHPASCFKTKHFQLQQSQKMIWFYWIKLEFFLTHKTCFQFLICCLWRLHQKCTMGAFASTRFVDFRVGVEVSPVAGRTTWSQFNSAGLTCLFVDHQAQ